MHARSMRGVALAATLGFRLRGSNFAGALTGRTQRLPGAQGIESHVDLTGGK